MAETTAKNKSPKVKARPLTETSESQSLVGDLYFGTAEKTIQESSVHSASLLKPYNPDDLYQKTGDYSIYEDMLTDDQVSVCQQLKKDLVIGAGWDLEAGEDGQEDIIEDIKIALSEDSEIPFDDCLQEILSAMDYGFSLTEKVFKHRDDNTLTLRVLKTRHPATFLIHTDKQGNISRYQQFSAHGKDLTVEPKSLIHYVNNRKFQNPYGTSDLRPAFNAWFVKRQISKFWAIFLEKAASPTPVAKYDKNAPRESVAEIHNAIKKLQTKTAITIPKDIEIEFLEAKNTGDAYEKALNFFNMCIGRALFVPDLLGLHGAQTSGGSLALGKEQMNVFIKHIQRRRKQLEDIVNNDIVWPIVFYNHGYIDNYPKFKLRPISDDQAIELAKLWLEAVKGRTYQASDEEINHFRTLVKFPTGDVDRPEMPTDNQDDEDGGDDENEKGKSASKKDGKTEPSKKDSESKEADEAKDKKSFAAKLPIGDYHKKCDFKAIKRQLEDYDASLMRDAKPIIALMMEDLLEQIQKKKIIPSGDISRFDGIKLKKRSDIKKLLKKSMRDIYLDGKGTAAHELFKGQYALPQAEDDFLELLEQELFNFIGDWEYQITKAARQEIIKAIKDGKPISSVIDFISEDGPRDAAVSLERFARTKHTEVLNKGRLAFFEDSGVVAAYQYSAILDDVTSDICRGLDGKVFAAGTQPVPPMHFNCRSLLIPITKYEQWEADKKVGSQSIDSFIDDNKGKGFPTQ